MKACAILNPNAGSADDISALKDGLKRLGEITLKITESENDATKMARQALEEGCETVIAAGGDGTINEVVNGLSYNFKQARLGIIPLGTGNDFARSINVPAKLEEALKILGEENTLPLDVGRYEGNGTRYFVNVSAGGFSGLVNEKLTDEMKKSWGPLAYLRSAVEAIPNLEDYHTFVTFDEAEEYEEKIYNIVIANAQYVAGGTPIAPEACFNDGLFDIVIVPAASMLKLAVLVPQIMLGQHLNSDLVKYCRARKVHIRSNPGIWLNVDGELMGNDPATFECLPGALRVICGPEPKNGDKK